MLFFFLLQFTQRRSACKRNTGVPVASNSSAPTASYTPAATPFAALFIHALSVMSSQAGPSAAAGALSKRTTNLKRITNGKHKRNASNGPSKRPAFILKLWTMVNDESNSDYIKWTPDGESFKVLSKENFEKVVLPKYFKHSNYSSFVRQLNMYGWHKVQDITSGAMQSGDEIRQFKSPYFIRGREDLLDSIVRNKSSKGSDDEDEGDMGRILDELDAIKSNQLEIVSDLNRMRSDNQLLWREAYESRERHKAHAETFERILRFLASLYSSGQNKFVDTASPGHKQQRLLLPNLSEMSNGQISELSSGNLPLSAIEEMISNNSNAGKHLTPTKSGRISTISPDDFTKLAPTSHVSDVDTPKSNMTSPESFWTEPVDDSSVVPKSKIKSKSRPSLSDANVENNIYTSPPTTLSSKRSSTSSTSKQPIKKESPPTAYPSANGTTAASAPVASPSTQATTATPNNAMLVTSSDPFTSFSQQPNGAGALSPFVSSDIPLTPLVNDALYNTTQDMLHDDGTAKQLMSNENDLDSIIQNINMQGESLQRLQDRIKRYTPYKEESNPFSPSTDAAFDVDEFLMNTTSDMMNSPNDLVTEPNLLEDMGPPQKRSKVVEEK